MSSGLGVRTRTVPVKVAPRPAASSVGSSSARGPSMNAGTTGHTADTNFIVESLLSGAPPWLQLSSETTLTYAFFGGNSPFANWVGDDPREWEHFPTSESLFLTESLGERIHTWAREFDRCAYTDRRDEPAVDDPTFVDTVLEGLRLTELIRGELPYYFVVASFVDSVPRSIIEQVDAAVPSRPKDRKLDGRNYAIDRRRMTFQPYESRKAPPGRSSLSTAIVADLGHYGGSIREPLGEFWQKLDEWQARWEENFLGLPKQRGGTPVWRPGFDRLSWMAEGLALQHESHTALKGVHLSCGAAYLAVSKSEWDVMLANYIDSLAGEPHES